MAIESSCDDTAVAILENDKVLSNIIASQEVHKEFGGVVPELASRAHQQNIIPVVDTALKRAGISKSDLDAVAFTEGPGLLGSLIVGASFAKSFAFLMIFQSFVAPTLRSACSNLKKIIKYDKDLAKDE